MYSEVKETPFTFYFSEITTSQMKKQCDAYATYYFNFFQQIITEYLGALFMGKCTVDDLLKHPYQMLNKLEF